jgi:hypothetical protein
MNEQVKKNYKPENNIFGLPQEFKGLKLYPILLKDLHYQEIFYKIFARPKNYLTNIEILKASYLKFIIYVLSSVEGGDEFDDLVSLLKYITKQEEVELLIKQNNAKGFDSFDVRIKIGDIILNETDFDDIREIVLEQNNMSIEYVEAYNPELEEHLKFLNRGSSDLDLQDQIFTLCAIMKIPLSEVVNYTLFQFNNLFERILTLKEYDLYKPLLVSGQITLKSGEIKHYLYHSRRNGRYDALFVDPEDFMKKNQEAFG